MKLKEAILMPCGFRYVVEALDIQSGVARRTLLEQEWCTDPAVIEAMHRDIHTWADALSHPDHAATVRTIRFRLQGLKDLRTTLSNLSAGHVLDDIELFEVKHLALLSMDLSQALATLDRPLTDDGMEDVVRLLDPDGLKIATFYIYDAYSDKLAAWRRQLEQDPHNEQVYTAIEDEELRIRTDLSRKLVAYAEPLSRMLQLLVQLDISMAKAQQLLDWGLCLPTLVQTESSLTDMWNPQVQAAVEQKGGHYQRVSIRFGSLPVVITGSNMGGKTVVLKTVALCQMMTQFGMGVPAAKAELVLRDQLYCCMGDGQNIESGLSSFAAEMKLIDAVIGEARRHPNIMALIDEPARTTNPVEGTALVSGLIDTLQPLGICTLLVTHYTISAHACACLRVRGMVDSTMDYTLVPALPGQVPHEAFTIARQLGVDSIWLDRAGKHLEENK